MASQITSLISEDKRLRLRVARLDDVFEEALSRHKPEPLAGHAIGRALTSAALFPWEWKAGDVENEERVAIQWSGRGKLGTIVCEVREPARLRVMVSRPETPGSPLVDKRGRARNTGLSDGFTSVLSQDFHGRVTQGMVDLVDGSLDVDLEAYFVQSQQVATRLRAFVAIEPTPRAFGVLLQALPGTEPDHFANFDGFQKLDAESTLDDAIAAALGDQQPKVLSTIAPSYTCPCTRERIERSIRLLDIPSLEDMLAVDKGAEVTCEFCREEYKFGIADLEAAILDKRAAGQEHVQ